MKRLVALAIVLMVLTLAFSWDKAPPWLYVMHLQRMQTVISEQNTRIATLETERSTAVSALAVSQEELTEAKVLADLVTNYDSLTQQIASLQKQRNSISAQMNAELSAARSELTAARNATNNIQTALGTLIAYRFTCCGSMIPTITENDLVLVLMNPPSFEIDDIVGVIHPECHFTNRIVAKVEGGWRIKGDFANIKYNPQLTQDGLMDNCVITAANVVYRVEKIIKDVWC